MTTHPFLTAAETRAAHLRELSLHLRALEVDTADLADVEREIPELEAAMAVYRRIHSTGTALVEGAIPKTTATPRAASASASSPSRKAQASTRRAPARRRVEAPSFKDFARNHLDDAHGESASNGNGRREGADGFAHAGQPTAFPAS